MLINVSQSAVINGVGRAEIALGPVVYGQNWQVNRVTISGDGADKPTFRMYKTVESNTTFLDGSRNGNGDSSETNIQVFCMDRILCVWTNGTPGANVGVVIQGVTL